MVALEWSKEFELICDVSDYAVGAVLWRQRDKVFHAIYYANKVLNDAQLNYVTTEKEMLAIHIREIQIIFGGFQSSYIYWSCNNQISSHKGRFKAKVDHMGPSNSRVWYSD